MNQPNKFALLGVFLTSLAVLTLEIVFTRVFSVLMWYHFAFMVISLALLGSGTAGVWLYLSEGLFQPEKTNQRLALLAFLFAVSTVIAFWLYLRIPFEFKTISKEGLSWATVGWLALIYLILSIPFLFGGAVIALAISRFSRSVGRVYFFDLAGAGLGCIVSILALSTVGAANAVLLVSILAATSSLLFAWAARPSRWPIVSGFSLILLIGFLAGNQAFSWLQVRAKGGYDARNEIVYEKWNALARVSVYKDPHWLQPFGWGLSSTYLGPDPGHLMLLIDANAGTPIQKWDGSVEMIDFLRYDLTSLAYQILPDANTFIIGSGGGRDILTGLLFGAKHITGAELNPAIVEAAQTEFGAYAGHVYDYPNVQVVIEDARTYLSRTDEQFDLIQASLIDTWAASSSGAYSLSENGLYTRQAYLTLFDRLSPRGMISYSRWYFIEDPTETLRMVALGMDSWQKAGIENPAQHIVVIANFTENRSAEKGLATMLMKKTPFTPDEVTRLAHFSEEMAFTVLYAPGYETVIANPVDDLIKVSNLNTAVSNYHLDISIPTDDRPFFFNFVNYDNLVSPEFSNNPAYRSSAEANYALLSSLAISALFAILFIIGPVSFSQRKALLLSHNWSYLLYFATLGLGFMMVLVPSIQRLTIYLGSPTYALTVVLFTILLSSGVGSLTTHRITEEGILHRIRLVIFGLLLVITVHLLFLPLLVQWTQAWIFLVRIIVVVVIIFPAGFLMGQPFPLGMKWVNNRNPKIIPWLWAINGATSVIGSTLSTVLGLALGFRAVSIGGLLCYGLTLTVTMLIWLPKSRQLGAAVVAAEN